MTKLEITAVEKAINTPFADWAHRCHEISIAIVKAGLVPGGRVARGFAKGVQSQHSWIVIGDPYGRKSEIIDPTLWSYDKKVQGIWHGSMADKRHTPHGAGHIFNWGLPQRGTGPIIELDTSGLSRHVHTFLDMTGPLDAYGWGTLLSQAPVDGWPAAEIVARAYADSRLKALIPIDRVGMLTDVNPGGLYF